MMKIGTINVLPARIGTVLITIQINGNIEIKLPVTDVLNFGPTGTFLAASH